MRALFFILFLSTFVSSQDLVCREGTILNNTQCTPDPSKCNLLKAAYNGCCITDVARSNLVGGCGPGTTGVDKKCELSSNNNVEDCGALKRAYNEGKCCGQAATNASDIGQAATNASDIGQAATNASDIGQAATNASDIGQAATNASDIGQAATNASDIGHDCNPSVSIIGDNDRDIDGRTSDIDGRTSLSIFGSVDFASTLCPNPIYEWSDDSGIGSGILHPSPNNVKQLIIRPKYYNFGSTVNIKLTVSVGPYIRSNNVTVLVRGDSITYGIKGGNRLIGSNSKLEINVSPLGLWRSQNQTPRNENMCKSGCTLTCAPNCTIPDDYVCPNDLNLNTFTGKKTFTVTPTSTSTDWCEATSHSVTLNVIDQGVIDCTFGPYDVHNSNEKLLLNFHCTPTNYTYTLKIDPPLDNSLITTFKTAIVVKPGALEADSTYTFTINVTGSDGGTTIMSKNVVVAGPRPPRGGTCTVNPNIGTAIDTEFTISCSGWQDEYLPLTYQFFYSTGGVFQQLSGESWNSASTFNLPAGDPNNENQLQIVATIVNQLGVSSTFKLNVTVTPATDAALGDDLLVGDPSSLLRL